MFTTWRRSSRAETVNTLPPQTLVAFRDHGEARLTIEDDLDGERARLDELEAAGVSLDEVTDSVLADGVRLFIEPFEKLIASIESQRAEIVGRTRANESAAD